VALLVAVLRVGLTGSAIQFGRTCMVAGVDEVPRERCAHRLAALPGWHTCSCSMPCGAPRRSLLKQPDMRRIRHHAVSIIGT
jgi:hypothetical protein